MAITWDIAHFRRYYIDSYSACNEKSAHLLIIKRAAYNAGLIVKIFLQVAEKRSGLGWIDVCRNLYPGKFVDGLQNSGLVINDFFATLQLPRLFGHLD